MNTSNAQAAKKALSNELTKRGIPLGYLAFTMPQLAVETGGFESRASKVNNLSGMVFVGQAGAYNSGIQKPKGEKKGTYAGYKSLDLWAADYVKTLIKMGAFAARSLDEYATILKAHGYFEAELPLYKKALNSWLPQMKKLMSEIDFLTPNLLPAIIILFITFIILS
jgi:hypothetical protein